MAKRSNGEEKKNHENNRILREENIVKKNYLRSEYCWMEFSAQTLPAVEAKLSTADFVKLIIKGLV